MINNFFSRHKMKPSIACLKIYKNNILLEHLVLEETINRKKFSNDMWKDYLKNNLPKVIKHGDQTWSISDSQQGINKTLKVFDELEIFVDNLTLQIRVEHRP